MGYRRLFRVYAHIYYCHFDKICELRAEGHLNTCFKHFVYFVEEFGLIPNKAELAPLQHLIDNIRSGCHKKTVSSRPTGADSCRSCASNTCTISGASMAVGEAAQNC